MGDWPAQAQDYNRHVIGTMSPESIGFDANGQAIVHGSFGSATWPSANRAIFIPFVVSAPWLVARLLVVNGSAASGNIDVGIYDTSGNRLVSAGSTAQAGTTAAQFFDITDSTLAPGVYYFALALDNTTGAVLSVAPVVARVSALGVLSQSTAFPLPATATFAAAQDAYVPMIGASGRTV